MEILAIIDTVNFTGSNTSQLTLENIVLDVRSGGGGGSGGAFVEITEIDGAYQLESLDYQTYYTFDNQDMSGSFTFLMPNVPWINKIIEITYLGINGADHTIEGSNIYLDGEVASSIIIKHGQTYNFYNDGNRIIANLLSSSGGVTEVNGQTSPIVTLTTADIAESTDKNYVTDAQQTVLGNTSNTNSGDETASSIQTKLGATISGGSSVAGTFTGSSSGMNTGDNAPNANANAYADTSIENLKSDLLVSVVKNIANPAEFNYNQYVVSPGGFAATTYGFRSSGFIPVNVGDKISARGLGFRDTTLGSTGTSLGGYFDENFVLVQRLRMKTVPTAGQFDAVDSIHLNAEYGGGGIKLTVPAIPTIKYVVLNFLAPHWHTAAASPVLTQAQKDAIVLQIERGDVITPFEPFGGVVYGGIKDELLTGYLQTNILLENGKIKEEFMLADTVEEMFHRGRAVKNYTTTKKVGGIALGQSNTEGRVPEAQFPSTYVDDDGVVTNYLDVNGEIPQSFYCKRNVAGTFVPYNPPSLWAYDGIVLSKLQHKLNDSIYLINYSQGGTGISTAGIDGGGFWTPRFEDIDLYNELNSDTNVKLLSLLEQSIRNAQSEDYEIRFMLFHQGESDTTLEASLNYYRNFKELIAYVRGILDNPTLPVIFGTISHASLQYNTVVEQAQLRIASEDPFVYAIDMSAGTLLDPYHFDAASTEYLGTEMYKIIRDEILKLEL